MVQKTLVALDTEHIKQYVFPSDKLKEIRGASSLLDRLNRNEMKAAAKKTCQWYKKVYANGGSGMFIVDTDSATAFCRDVEQRYREATAGGASITCVTQNISQDIPDDDTFWDVDLKKELAVLRYKLQAKKNCQPASMVLPSHPFLRPCDACGLLYAEPGVVKERDADEGDKLYCQSCLNKRDEDGDIKKDLKDYANTAPNKIRSPLWRKVIKRLVRDYKYRIPEGTERPKDFNEFRKFAGSKEYLGLIYADGNGMGQKTEDFTTLKQWKNFAKDVDKSIYEAVCETISKYLAVQEIGQEALFPFDLLLLGGDDVLMVTTADAALDVALAIAQRFHDITEKRDPQGVGHTLSVGVILAPIKYPFGLLHDLAEGTLKQAKKAGSKRCMKTLVEDGKKTLVPFDENERKTFTAYEDTFINFLTVSGSISQSFDKVYATLHDKHGRVLDNRQGKDAEFYATLRPYTVEEMKLLLDFIREGKQKHLGRTKLHQVREAILRKNLTTSVGETRAVLRNWHTEQREFVANRLQTFANYCQHPFEKKEEPGTSFPRVTFPWFANDPKNHIYRTVLLDFVELYDFVRDERRS